MNVLDNNISDEKKDIMTSTLIDSEQSSKKKILLIENALEMKYRNLISKKDREIQSLHIIIQKKDETLQSQVHQIEEWKKASKKQEIAMKELMQLNVSQVYLENKKLKKEQKESEKETLRLNLELATTKKKRDEYKKEIYEKEEKIAELESMKTAKKEKEQYELKRREIEEDYKREQKKLIKEKQRFIRKREEVVLTSAGALLILGIIIMAGKGILINQIKEFFQCIKYVLDGMDSLASNTLLLFHSVYNPWMYYIIIGFIIVGYILLYYAIVFFLVSLVQICHKAYFEKHGIKCRYICSSVIFFLSIFDEYAERFNSFATALTIWLLFWCVCYILDYRRYRIAFEKCGYNATKPSVDFKKGDLFFINRIIREYKRHKRH